MQKARESAEAVFAYKYKRIFGFVKKTTQKNARAKISGSQEQTLNTKSRADT